MRKSRKPLAAAMALALVAALGIGGAIAWLTDETGEVNNTFTVGNIGIDLTETTGATYKMVPGTVLPKDPTVVVKAGSEDCWVFLRVDQTANLDDFVEFGVDPNNWTKLEGKSAVVDGEEVCSFWYCKAEDVDAARMIKVIGYEDADGAWHPNQVLVRPSVTKEMMDGLTEGTQPRLVFRACAVQMENLETVEDAWAQAPDEFKNV